MVVTAVPVPAAAVGDRAVVAHRLAVPRPAAVHQAVRAALPGAAAAVAGVVFVRGSAKKKSEDLLY